MTSPYITFEEMEEGKRYIAFCRNSSGSVNSDLRYYKRGERLRFDSDTGSELNSSEDYSQLVFIPVYSPPNSWDEYVDGMGDFAIVRDDKNHWFWGSTRREANTKELQAAIDWLQDELDRRKKAGES